MSRSYLFCILWYQNGSKINFNYEFDAKSKVLYPKMQDFSEKSSRFQTWFRKIKNTPRSSKKILLGPENKLKNTKPLEKKVCKMIQKSEKI